MAVYGVKMGQGVTASLNGNTLFTGYISDAGDRLQSCSAVAFCNTITQIGGLYHFPAGSINNDAHSQNVLQQIVAAVAPDRGWIGFGVSEFLDIMTGSYDMSDRNAQNSAGEHEQLRAYVLKLLPLECRLSRCGAKSGNASLSWAAGQPVFSVAGDQGGITDLSAVAAGPGAGYTVYGHDMN